MGRGPGVRTVGKQSIQIDFVWKGVRYRPYLRLKPNAKNQRYAKNLKASIELEIEKGTFDYHKTFGKHPRRGKDAAASDAKSEKVQAHLDAFLKRAELTVRKHTHKEYSDAAKIVCAGKRPAKLGEDPELIPNFGVARLQDLKLGEIEDWLESLNLSAKRQNNLLIPLRRAIKNAVRRGEITKNPLAELEIVNRGKRVEIDPFTHAEVELLGSGHQGPMWVFWAWTGLRTGEMAALKWNDIDVDSGRLRIERAFRLGDEKGPKTLAGRRSFKLLPPALAALLALPGNREGPVFINPVNEQGFTSDKQIRTAFGRDVAHTGVRYRYPYQLRHTFASWAMAAEEPIKWIAHCMGHKDASQVLKTYARYMPDLYDDAGEKMTKKGSLKAVS